MTNQSQLTKTIAYGDTMTTSTIVSVVDDDRAVTDSLRALIESAGYEVETFQSAEEFLASYDAERPGCIILDERMPGMSGHALQKELVTRRALSPVILITAHAEVPMTVDVMRLGAVTLLQKPFRDQLLLDAIEEALRRDAGARERHADRNALEERLRELTPRQRDVMELLIHGLPNKLIASELGISERTVELHRSRVLSKMNAGSAAELARQRLVS
jgi:two-component system, LuxR family, response regulator FixJ